MTRLEEIELRLKEIRTAAATATAEELAALEDEAQRLMQERTQLMETAQRRTALLDKIAVGAVGEVVTHESGGLPAAVTESRSAENGMTENEKLFASAEYRTAWLLSMQGRNLSAAQQNVLSRAAVTIGGSAANVVPTETANKIVELVKQYAPIFDKLTMVMHVNGNFDFAFERSRTRAKTHAENAEAEAEDLDLINVSLSAYEILKLVQVSASVKYMTIDGFESWLTNMLAKSVAEEINYLLIYGTGTKEGKGIEYGNTWVEGTNQLTVGASATLSKADVYKLCGMLPAKYDKEAVFLMSKKTMLQCFDPLQDKSKDEVFKMVGKDGYVLGCLVMQDDNIPLGTAYHGDLTTIGANLPQNITLNQDYDIRRNSNLYNCAAMFDCQMGRPDAFVKLTKASAENTGI